MGSKFNSIPDPLLFHKEEIDRLDDKLIGVYLLLPNKEIDNPQYTRIGNGHIKSGLHSLLSQKAPGAFFTYIETDERHFSEVKRDLLQIYKKWPPENMPL